jgi:hypothetical protein
MSTFLDGTKSLYASKWAQNPKLLSRIPLFLSTRVLTMLSLLWSSIMILVSSLTAETGHNRIVYFTISACIFAHHISDCLDGAVGRFRKEGYVFWGFFTDHFFDVAFLGCISISIFLHQPQTHLSLLSLFSCQMIWLAHFLADLVAATSNTASSYTPMLLGFSVSQLELLTGIHFLVFGLLDISRHYVCYWFTLTNLWICVLYFYKLQEKYAILDRQRM